MQRLWVTEISLKQVFFRVRPFKKLVSNETDEIFMKIVYLGGVEYVQKFSSKSERVRYSRFLIWPGIALWISSPVFFSQKARPISYKFAEESISIQYNGFELQKYL